MNDKDTQATDQRTQWSQDRTIMANERTYASWLGAGMGCVGVAIGLHAVFGKVEPTWPAKIVASVFLGIAITLFLVGRYNAIKTFRRLTESDVEAVPGRNFHYISYALAVGAMGIAAILWSL